MAALPHSHSTRVRTSIHRMQDKSVSRTAYKEVTPSPQEKGRCFEDVSARVHRSAARSQAIDSTHRTMHVCVDGPHAHT